MSKIGNITLIFKFQSTNDLETNYGIIFELDNYEFALKIVDTHPVKRVSVNQLKWIYIHIMNIPTPYLKKTICFTKKGYKADLDTALFPCKSHS